MDSYFLKKNSSGFYDTIQIEEACRKLTNTNGLISIRQLAYHTNMSLKTLERKFTEKVGVSPKMFARFHQALSFMNKPKPLSWTHIIYHCGYYDQAHFIKEFKTFTQQLPSAYFQEECFLYNQLILYRNFVTF